VPHSYGGSQGGSPKKQRLNKANATLDERTRKEEMFRGLHVITAKTIGRQVATEGG